MSRPERQSPIDEKLNEIRDRLLGNPSPNELSAMQLHIDVLEKWARVANNADADHQHNHMDDHDNTKFVEPFVVLDRSQQARLK